MLQAKSFYRTEKQYLATYGFQKKFHQNPLKLSPVSESQLQNYVRFSPLTSGLTGPGLRPTVQKFYIASMKMGGA